MRKFYRLVLYLLFILCCTNLSAQKFGAVDKSVLEATSIEGATEADAVYLFKKGEIEIRRKGQWFTVVTRHHERIKVLSEVGKRHGDFSIDVYDEEELSTLKAATIGVDGARTDLDRDDVFQEDAEGFHRRKFALPAVTVGSVLDVYYVRETDDLSLLRPWYFQEHLPILRSEFEISVPVDFKYSALFRNAGDWDTTPHREEYREARLHEQYGTRFRWEYQNVSELKNEPLVNNIHDYATAIHFRINEFNSYMGYEQFGDNWEEYGAKFYEWLGPIIEDAGAAKEWAKNLDPSLSTIDKIATIYRFVRDNVKLESLGLLRELSRPKEVFEFRAGDAREMNLLLLSLLREAGVEADPVLIRTRSRGRFYENQVNISLVNGLIVRALNGRKRIYLDATDRNCPFGRLPLNSDVRLGVLVTETKGQVVKIPSNRKLSSVSVVSEVTLKLDSLHCSSQIRYEAYDAIEARKSIRAASSSEFALDLLQRNLVGVRLETAEVVNLDSVEKPLHVTVEYSLPIQEASDNLVLFSTPFIANATQNPFVSETRQYPIDFPYKRSISERISISLAEGWIIDELPESVTVRGNKMNFGYQYLPEEGTIKAEHQFTRRSTMVDPADYQSLREFYTHLASAAGAQIVLRLQ